MNPADFALYKENEGVGNYSVREWQDTKTARVTYGFNLNHDDPVKGPIFLVKRFRQAMSLAINRDEINEFAFQGLATPQQFTVFGSRVLRSELGTCIRRLRSGAGHAAPRRDGHARSRRRRLARGPWWRAVRHGHERRHLLGAGNHGLCHQ